MKRIRLEIDEIKIYRPKKRWNLYFIIVADHPTDGGKKIITHLPKEQPIKLHQRHKNKYQFDADQPGAEGLYVLSQDLPENREANVHIYMMHTRNPLRQFGETLAHLEEELGENTFGIVEDIMGNSNPALVVAKKAVSLVGKIIAKIPDRKLGFVSCFERFGPEFENEIEIDREKEFSGPASIVYSWSLED